MQLDKRVKQSKTPYSRVEQRQSLFTNGGGVTYDVRAARPVVSTAVVPSPLYTVVFPLRITRYEMIRPFGIAGGCHDTLTANDVVSVTETLGG
jgi:hypothetical protein